MTAKPATILLVEEDPAHAELIKRNFRRHKVPDDLYHVSDGAEALDYFHRRGYYSDPKKSPRPKLVLLDHRLPKVDDLEVLREIKSDDKFKSIPVVILTTSHARNDVDQAYREYANSYLVKPTNPAKFKQLMADLGFFWLSWNYWPFVEGDFLPA